VSIPWTLDDLQRAWETEDPIFLAALLELAGADDPEIVPPPRAGALTWDAFLTEIHSRKFRTKSLDEQAHYRQATVALLEAPTAEVPLPPRLRLHALILAIARDERPFARTWLLRIVRQVPLRYGPWRALKTLFKQAEARHDTELLGALAARFDREFAAPSRTEVSRLTLGYLVRRAWRYLRRVGETYPVTFADVAADFLSEYAENTDWSGTWVANHLLFHETKKYGWRSFHLSGKRSLTEHRAFGELWKRSPRPLFSLLERAQSNRVREFAIESLKKDFRSALREVEPGWVAGLVRVPSAVVAEFVVWILNNVPRFEQAAFRTLGLHEAVLQLFDSTAVAAQAYAAQYARTHARDLPADHLLRLANHDHEAVHKLACDLLAERDPRSEVGLDRWGRLLETRFGSTLAAAMLRKHFGAKELTPAWFRERLLSHSLEAAHFAAARLLEVHSAKDLGLAYFIDLVDQWMDLGREQHVSDETFKLAMAQVEKHDLKTLPAETLQTWLLFHRLRGHVIQWFHEGKIVPDQIPLKFYQALAYAPDWERDPWITALRAGGRPWGPYLLFDESLAQTVLGWLGDVRKFSPATLGFEWLLELVQRSEPLYHEFAQETLIRSFLPADFAPRAAAAAKPEPARPATVDLGQSSFLFTGKLATMSRAQAEDKVRQAGGSLAGSVSPKLAYLVIGDEGSPLYGHGKKGSKQLAAEKLIASGSSLKVISETAFLKMLVGEQATHSADAVEAGCERLWAMAAGPGKAESPLARFALKYFRRHHPEMCLAETDRPVDPGAEIPASFLSFARFKPLFLDPRKVLREFAISFACYEFARWQPPMSDVVDLCEAPYAEVRSFVSQSLLADDAPEHARSRLNPAVLTPTAVYSFCEAREEATRALGMALILREPRLQLPEELFRLTESPDRKVRAFVVRTFWSLYRERAITSGWKPSEPAVPAVTAGAKKPPEKEGPKRGSGPPARPAHPPASLGELRDWLRRLLFELPGSRSSKPAAASEQLAVRLLPLPARRAKRALVEVLRDLALEDAELAALVAPLLAEFAGSRGPSERAACLVAVTRLRHRHAQLGQELKEAIQ